jgi:hypothetical protein
MSSYDFDLFFAAWINPSSNTRLMLIDQSHYWWRLLAFQQTHAKENFWALKISY